MEKMIMAEDFIEDIEDYKLAVKRITSQRNEIITWEKVLEKFGITENQLEQLDDIEFD